MSDVRIPSQREAAILSILINGEKYGREIRNQYEERTERQLPLGALYVTLSRMEDSGLIESRMGESVHERGGNRRKYFKMTGLGERALAAYDAYILAAHGGRLAWSL
jgi:PadR family transcriptional regulator, regulatory protein PadR